MRKFKHLPTGKEYTCNGAGGIILTDGSTNVPLPLWIIDNSKDWQEIKVDNYQILSFKNTKNGNIYVRNLNGTYGWGLNITGNDCMNRYAIYEVLRTDDKIKFRVGETAIFPKSGLKTIKRFWVSSDGCLVVINDDNNYEFGCDIIEIAKPKQITLNLKPYFGKYILLPDDTKIPVSKGDKLLIEF